MVLLMKASERKNGFQKDLLQKIVLDARWLKQIPKYLTFRYGKRLQNFCSYFYSLHYICFVLFCFRSTAELESFHNHILMYASKRFAFTPPVYKARVTLAALDYNNHLNRGPKIKKDGTYQLVFYCHAFTNIIV